MLLLSGFALGVMAVLVLTVARDFGHLREGKVFIALVIAGSFVMLHPLVPSPWKNMVADIYTLVPALFWLLCLVAFAYRPRLLSLSGALAIYTFTAKAISRNFSIDQEPLSQWYFLGWVLPTYGEYFLIALGIWIVVSNWSDDLVESRRRLRGVMLIGVGTCVFLVIIPITTGLVGMWLPYLAIIIVSLLCAYSLLMGRFDDLFGVESIPPNPTGQALNTRCEPNSDSSSKHNPETNEEVLKHDALSLNKLMDEGFYRTEHLTLKILAEQLDMPQYKTRALINQTLGYRNFNDYINQLRVNEAAQRLLDDVQTPVLNISLDVGYRTLSSFNRAFKDIQNMSPSQYRQASLAPQA